MYFYNGFESCADQGLESLFLASKDEEVQFMSWILASFPDGNFMFGGQRQKVGSTYGEWGRYKNSKFEKFNHALTWWTGQPSGPITDSCMTIYKMKGSVGYNDISCFTQWNFHYFCEKLEFILAH